MRKKLRVALAKFSAVLLAAKRAIAAMHESGDRASKEMLQCTLMKMRDDVMKYKEKLQNIKQSLRNSPRARDIQDSVLTLQQITDVYVLNAVHDKDLYFLNAAYEQYRISRASDLPEENVFQKSPRCRAVVHEARVLHGSIVYEFLEAPQV